MMMKHAGITTSCWTNGTGEKDGKWGKVEIETGMAG